MSRLDELKDNLRARALETWDKIRESDSYIKISDKYQSLSPSGQKITRFVTVILLLFLVFFYPLSQLQISHTLVSEFESKRILIRDFFRTYRETGAYRNLPPTQDSNLVISSVRSVLSASQLTPEQIITVSPIDSPSQILPQGLVNNAVEVKLNQVNLRQIVDVGSQLNNIAQSVKVKDLFIQASKETQGYFSVTYKLYSLRVPESPPEPPPEPPKPSKKNNASGDQE